MVEGIVHQTRHNKIQTIKHCEHREITQNSIQLALEVGVATYVYLQEVGYKERFAHLTYFRPITMRLPTLMCY